MATSKGKAPMTSEAEQSLSTNKAAVKETFWTSCYGCRMYYQYPKIFLKEKIICSKCEVPFEALETPPRKKPTSKPQVKQIKKKQPERKGRRNNEQEPERKGRRNNEQEEWRKMLMEKGKKETTDLINRLKGLSM